jgi:hypothetical protein
MICQACGVEAPTKYVAFYKNIGALVMRFFQSVEGNLCKSCIHKYFWRFTLTDLFLGWWGVISFFITPFLILNNLARYVLCLGMEGVPPGAVPPQLTREVIEKLQPYTEDLIGQLKTGEDFHRAAENVAMRAGVTPGQVALYVRALVEAARQQKQ